MAMVTVFIWTFDPVPDAVETALQMPPATNRTAADPDPDARA